MELRRKACKLRLPDYLRGDVAAWGESVVEHEEATDRYYSQDDIKRALAAILNLESLPTETRLKRAFRTAMIQMSGTNMSDETGVALAKAIEKNTTLRTLTIQM